MKRLVVALVMFGVVVGLCVVSVWVQQKTVSGLLDEVNHLQEDYADENFDVCLERAKRLAEEFPDRTAVLEWFVGHRALHSAHESLAVLPTMLKHEDHHNFAVRLKECELELTRLQTKGLPLWENIV